MKRWTAGKLLIAGGVLAALAQASPTFTIQPTFDSSITSNVNAAQIESTINVAITAIEGLYTVPYSTSVTIPVTFTYDPAAAGNLASSDTEYYSLSYSAYKTLLENDSTANPGNTTLATALANLGSGNDANGSANMAITGALLTYLGDPENPDATVNINSNVTNWGFTQPVSGADYDLTGSLEHELDEILGGGGAGSTLNAVADGCTASFFCGKYGSLDLYRYSAPGTPSYTISGSATSYFSINGGTTSIVAFNQNSGGDYADFAPNCGTGSGSLQLIQNAFNCTGTDEAYTTSSPEFEMLQAIGYDSSSSTPEPGTLGLLGGGLVLLGLIRYRRRRRRP